MAEPSGTKTLHHDPRGPVSVVGDVDLAVVRDALGRGAWIEPGSARPGLALVITTRRELAREMRLRDVPVVLVQTSHGTPHSGAVPGLALPSWLQAYADGELLSSAEAEARAWMNSVRDEEVREQERARRVEADGEREVQEQLERMAAQLERMAAHIAAVETSTSWKIARRLAKLKNSLPFRLGRSG
jgi:hypothetical protein